MNKQKYKITVVKVRNGEWKVAVNGAVYATVSSKSAAISLVDELSKRFAS